MIAYKSAQVFRQFALGLLQVLMKYFHNSSFWARETQSRPSWRKQREKQTWWQEPGLQAAHIHQEDRGQEAQLEGGEQDHEQQPGLQEEGATGLYGEWDWQGPQGTKTQTIWPKYLL